MCGFATPTGSTRTSPPRRWASPLIPRRRSNAAWAIGHDVDGEERKDIFQLQEEIEAAQNTQNGLFQRSAEREYRPHRRDLADAGNRLPIVRPATRISSASTPTTATIPSPSSRRSTARSWIPPAVRERILQMVQNLESGEVMLEPETIAPNVTVADLQKTVELRYRATHAHFQRLERGPHRKHPHRLFQDQRDEHSQRQQVQLQRHRGSPATTAPAFCPPSNTPTEPSNGAGAAACVRRAPRCIWPPSRAA